MDWLDLQRLQAVLLDSSHWIVQTFLAVLIALLADFLLRRLLTRLQRRLEVRTRTPWDDAVIDALRPPLSVLVWILGISFAADIVRQATHAPIFEAVGPLRTLGVVTVITWFLTRLVRHGQGIILKIERPDGTRPDFTTVDSIAKLMRVAILITAALVALQTLGFSISGVLAFGGIGGIAVGFAARDVLANFFGGMMVYLDRPFAVGDWIRSPDRDIEGIVEDISWRLTRIRTFDQRPLYVPNATFSTIAVENPSRMFNRRIRETVGIRYDDAAVLADIVAEVRQMLETHPEIDTGRLLMVNFNAFGPSSLDFIIYCFTRTTVWAQYHAVKQDVLFKILEIVDRHGAEIAFPTSTVHLPDGLTVRDEAQAAQRAAEARAVADDEAAAAARASGTDVRDATPSTPAPNPTEAAPRGHGAGPDEGG